MPSDSKFTRDDDGNVAVRVVSNTGVSEQPESMFTKDEDGNVAVRVVFGEGGGGGGGSDQHNLGWYATQAALEEAHPTAEAGDWAIVGATDTVWIWDTDNSEWVDSDQKGQVTSVNNQTGAVTVSEVPSQTGNAGKFLTTDGTDASWGTTVEDAQMVIKNTASSQYSAVNQISFYAKYNNSDGTAATISSTTIGTLRISGTSCTFDGNLLVSSSGKDIGASSTKWRTVFATQINNGADITVPNQAGTMVVADSTSATAGQVLTLDSNLQPVWQAGGSGGGLPDQTGHSGEFLTTDGTDASWAAVDALPDQTGNAGKFLTTDGTDASWSDKPLVNNNPRNTTSIMIGNIGSNISSIGGNSVCLASNHPYSGWVSLGNDSVAIGAQNCAGTNSVTVGASSATSHNFSTMVGYLTTSIGITGTSHNIALGAYARVGINGGTTVHAIQIGSTGSETTNSDSNTFKVGNANGNFELMSADGTIPTARLTKVNSTITLTAAGWSSNTQTVTVTGMTATGVVLVSPDPTDQSAYTSAGIICTTQAADSLTFTCSTTPTSDIDVNIVCL